MEYADSFFSGADLGVVALPVVMGTGAFVLFTISGGGGALVLLPVLNWLFVEGDMRICLIYCGRI